MITVALYQGDQERLSERLYLWVVETQPRKASRGAALGYGAADDEIVAPQVAGVRILVKSAFGSTGDEFFDDYLDSIFRGQVHHPVVVGPVVLSRSDLDGRPHEPVAENVHSGARRCFMVA